MKKNLTKALMLLIVTMVFVSCGADRSKLSINLIPFQAEEGNLWGYMDIKGNVKMEPKFHEMPSYFREGFAAVRNEDGTYDFINTQGENQGQSFTTTGMFFEGLAPVFDDQTGLQYVDKNFKTVIEMPNATNIGVFSEGLAKFQDIDGKWGFINKKGEVSIKPEFDFVLNFHEQFAVAHKLVGEKFVKMYINKKGEKAFELSEDQQGSESFSEGLAAYTDGSGWGFIDQKGVVIVPAKDGRSTVTKIINGYSSFKQDGKWGLIDKKGNKIVRQQYDHPLDFKGCYAAFKENDKIGFINRDGEVKIKPRFQDLIIPFIGDHAIVRDGSDFFIIDRDGKQFGSKEFAGINPYFQVLNDYESVVSSSVQPQMPDPEMQADGGMPLEQEEVVTEEMQPVPEEALKVDKEKIIKFVMGTCATLEKLIKDSQGNVEGFMSKMQGFSMSLQNKSQAMIRDQESAMIFSQEMQKCDNDLKVKYADFFKKLQEFMMQQQQNMQQQQMQQQNVPQN